MAAVWPVLSDDRLQNRPTIQIAQNDKSPKDVKKPSTRLPNGFGKLELTEDQKERIKGILGSFNGRIDDLEAQINDLREKRDAEVEAVLTGPQKAKLAALETESKKKKAEKSKSSKSAPAEASSGE